MRIAERLRSPWWTVFASVLGLTVGAGTVNTIVFAEFLKPISHSLDLGRGTVSFAASLAPIIAAFGSPIYGRMIDRWGIRNPLLVFIVLYAAAIAALSRLEVAPVQFYLLFAIAGVAGVGQTIAPYSKAVSAAFDKKRGIALGIALSGVGIGTIFLPILSALLIGQYGWRNAYLGLGLAIIVFAFVPVFLFLHEPAQSRVPRTGARPIAASRGLSAADALASWRFWALTMAFFLASTAINGVFTQVVALLTDRGISVAAATSALSAAGVSMIAGRLFCGICLDRFRGPVVAVAHFLCGLVGIALLWAHIAGPIPILAMLLGGFAVGALQNLLAFFIGRYFGLKSFGQLFGIAFGAVLLGIAFGSNVMAWSYQLLRSYGPAEASFLFALGIACVLVLPLGRYPFPIQAAGRPAATLEPQRGDKPALRPQPQAD